MYTTHTTGIQPVLLLANLVMKKQEKRLDLELLLRVPIKSVTAYDRLQHQATLQTIYIT